MTRPEGLPRRPFDFALLREEPSPDGIRVTATNEAINVLVGALDTEVASAVAAAGAKLESLLSRRRFGEAEQAARDARIRSIQWMAEVSRIIADTRLDVRRAGWDATTPQKLTEITEALDRQVLVERRMLEAMRDDRDLTDRPDLARSTLRLIAVVEDCLNRHRGLHTRVMDATEAFFAEHARQAFQPTTSLQAVDLYERLFLPVFRGAVGQVAPAVESFASGCWGVADLRVPSVARLFDILLADPRIIDDRGVELPDDELDDSDDPRLFPKEAWDAAEQALAAIEQPSRLSAILAQLRDDGETAGAELLGLIALKAADPALSDLNRPGAAVLAAADDGELFEGDDYVRADLLVGWLRPNLDAVAEARA